MAKIIGFSEESALFFSEENIVESIKGSKYGVVNILLVEGYLYANFADQPGNMFIPAGKSQPKKTELKAAIKRVKEHIENEKMDSVFDKVKSQMASQTFTPIFSKENIERAKTLLGFLPLAEKREVFITDDKLYARTGEHIAFTSIVGERTPILFEDAINTSPEIYTGLIEDKKKYFYGRETNIPTKDVGQINVPELSNILLTVNAETNDLMVGLHKAAASALKSTKNEALLGLQNISIRREDGTVHICSNNSYAIICTSVASDGKDFSCMIPAGSIQEELLSVDISDKYVMMTYPSGSVYIEASSYSFPMTSGTFEPLEDGDTIGSFTIESITMPEGKGDLVLSIKDGSVVIKRKRGREMVEFPFDGPKDFSKKITLPIDGVALLLVEENLSISVQEREGTDVFFVSGSLRGAITEQTISEEE